MGVSKLTEKILSAVNEETTSSAIAYLPGAFTSAKQMVNDLSRLKSQWNIKVLERGNNYEVMFEDAIKFTVPKELYKEFNDNVIKVEGVKMVDFTEAINEALKEAQAEIYARFYEALKRELKNNHQVRSTTVLMNHWLHTFSNSRFVPSDSKIALRLNDYDNDAKKLSEELERLYGDDFGSVDEIVSALEEGRPVGGLEGYDYIVGVKIQSQYNDIMLTLEMYVNSAMIASQSIYVDSVDVADELEDYRTVKVLYRKVFPIGQMFAPSIFGNIKSTIDGLD